MFKEYRLLADFEAVPKQVGGLYFFRLRFPSDFELGIDWNAQRPCDVESIVKITEEYFIKAGELITPSALDGEMMELGKASHMQSRFTVSAGRKRNTEMLTLLELNLRSAAYDDHRLRSVLSAVRHFFAHLPVAYVGMSSKQSLYDRLSQHINDTTGFASRIRSRGYGWNDLLFYALPLTEFTPGDTRNLEKLFQNLVQPTLSLY